MLIFSKIPITIEISVLSIYMCISNSPFCNLKCSQVAQQRLLCRRKCGSCSGSLCRKRWRGTGEARSCSHGQCQSCWCRWLQLLLVMLMLCLLLLLMMLLLLFRWHRKCLSAFYRSILAFLGMRSHITGQVGSSGNESAFMK